METKRAIRLGCALAMFSIVLLSIISPKTVQTVYAIPFLIIYTVMFITEKEPKNSESNGKAKTD